MKLGISVRATLVALCTMVAFGPAFGGDAKAIKPQTTCPVMGGPVKKDVFVDHEGQRIYLCCPACVDKFKADPQGYIKKLQDQGVTLEKPQLTCPVEGGKVDKNIFVDNDGKRIYLCCAGCSDKFNADPAQFLKKLKDQGVTLEDTPAKDGAKKEAKVGCPAAPGCPAAATCPSTKKGCCGGK